MRLDVDTKFRIKALIMFGLEFYKVMMGTMLTIFVPHPCLSSQPTTICSVGDVLQNSWGAENWWQRIAVGMNFGTMVAVLVLYGFELYREHWIIEHLDIDHSKPNDNLDSEIETYPEIKKAMSTLNRRYLEVSQSTTVLVVINFVLSALYMRSALTSASTFTSLLSFLVLVMIKLLTTRTNAQASVQKERALSAYMTVHKTFNVIDPDYRIQCEIATTPTAAISSI